MTVTASPATRPIRTKWRPQLALVLTLVLGTVLALPLAGLLVFHIYDNQLIRETESELVGQAAAIAAAAGREVEAEAVPDALLGPPGSGDPPEAGSEYRPIPAELDIATSPPLPPRPDAEPSPVAAEAPFVALGAKLMPDLVATQRVTLAGFRLLDPRGTVIAGRSEVGLSLAHVTEVAEALQGRFKAVLRRRISKHPDPPLGSTSRGTSVRVFVAMPILARGRVAGVLYASRTPDDVLDSLYAQRRHVMVAAASVFVAAALIGYVLYRTISVPVRDLVALSAALGTRNTTDASIPLHLGTVEFAALAAGLLTMASRLTERSEAVSTFAAHVSHELKSPLTAIRGAAELLRDDGDAASPRMDDTQRNEFLDNILSDAERLDALLKRLRELAQAEGALPTGETTLRPIVEAIRRRNKELNWEATGALDDPVQLPAETATAVLAHLSDNAAQHGARRLVLSAAVIGARVRITVRDDGRGIPSSHRHRIFEPFFTTRRDDGGTGMGLAITSAMLRAQGGRIEAIASDAGASFVLDLPAVVLERSRRRGLVTALRSMVVPTSSSMVSRLARLSAVAAVIAAGLVLRLSGPALRLPFEITEYGGFVLWGAMVYGLVTVILPDARPARAGLAALGIAVAAEAARLVHWLPLDAVRLSLPGTLLPGPVFSPWTILAYLGGILAWAGRDAATRRRNSGRDAPSSVREP